MPESLRDGFTFRKKSTQMIFRRSSPAPIYKPRKPRIVAKSPDQGSKIGRGRDRHNPEERSQVIYFLRWQGEEAEDETSELVRQLFL
jgi:hypothetical protein